MSTESVFRLPRRLAGLHPSQIRENMRIAAEVGAINMAQGRPDFPATDQLKQAAARAILDRIRSMRLVPLAGFPSAPFHVSFQSPTQKSNRAES
jgi:aspartate/methionine/tyrosine aminotransferase